MLKLRKRLLAAGLAAVLSVSAASLPVWSDAEAAPVDAAQTADTAQSAEGDAAPGEASETDDGNYVTEAEALAAMEVMAQNKSLKLYVDKKTGLFAVEDTANNHKWWSGYYNTDPKNKSVKEKRCTPLSLDIVSTESRMIESSIRVFGNKDVTLTCSKIDNGVRFMYSFSTSKYGIDVPLDIVLNDNGTFTATVKTDLIKENKPETVGRDSGYKLINIHLLENMGAGGSSDEGMMVVTDGSGAVINYNNGAPKGDNNTYESKVYGDDLAVGKLYAGAVIEKVTMPVMANINSTAGAGLVMISTDGDPYAIEHAMVTKQTVTDLNSCWFEYAVRTTDKYFMGNKNEPLTVYETDEKNEKFPKIRTGDLSTTYYPIYGSDLSYIDVADVYRKYLTDVVGVQKKTADNDAPFYLTLYGGTVKTQSIAGFPVKIQTVATSYSEALEIIKVLENGGVNNIKIIYEDFNEAGIVGEIAATFQYSSKLGGKGEYEKFKKYVDSKNYDLFPSCDIMEFYKSGNGYSFTLNSSKQITQAYATQTPFELAFGLPHLTNDSWTILSPYYFPDIFNKLSDTFRAEKATGISLNQASTALYSDFSRQKEDGSSFFLREDTIKILQAGYKKLKDSGLSIMTENANQYILPYADFIKDVPLYSSNYDIFDYDIPFAEMVLHGLIPYTTKAINRSADADELRMLSLVTGTPIHYEMMYENPNKFADSEYDKLYYTNYKGWMDRAINEYNLFTEIISSISGAKITKYERISAHEIQTEFEGGTTIYVNTETGAIKYNNKSYDIKDYGLGVR